MKFDQNIESLFKAACDNDCKALYLRHSIREKITDATKSHTQLLTEEGKELARLFGAQLPHKRKIRLHYSNIKRCEETADFIKQGHKGQSEIVGANMIAAGFFVKNSDVVLQNANTAGYHGFISNWFGSFFTEDQMQNPIQARSEIIKHLEENSQSDSLNIYITHDWNIVLMSSLFYDVQKTEYPWPDFMNGIAYYKIGDKSYISLNGEIKEVFDVA
ncbi:MAG: hypothetical protein RBS89_09230 [Candidatus Delongbacteria bacterium]|jgi:hypothetical protein|nr:hypothetical protein [Candidatus Delongbacteria bacterium]